MRDRSAKKQILTGREFRGMAIGRLRLGSPRKLDESKGSNPA